MIGDSYWGVLVTHPECHGKKKKETKREKEKSHAGQVKLRIWLLLSTQESSTQTCKMEEKVEKVPMTCLP